MKNLSFIFSLDKTEEQEAELLAAVAQKKLEKIWDYSRKEVPDIQERVFSKIMKWFKLDWQPAKFDHRYNFDKALERIYERIHSDFKVLFEIQYKPNEYVSRARRNGFSYSFTHNVIFVFCPEDFQIYVETYYCS